MERKLFSNKSNDLKKKECVIILNWHFMALKHRKPRKGEG